MDLPFPLARVFFSLSSSSKTSTYSEEKVLTNVFFSLDLFSPPKLDPKIAPALQHQAEELKRAKLETALAHKIENRPPASELIDHNILHGKEKLS